MEEDQSCIRTLEGHSEWVLALAVHKDTIISGSRDTTIKLWTLEGECIRTLKGHSSWVWSLAVHKDTIISGSGTGRSNYGPSRGRCIRTLKGHLGYTPSPSTRIPSSAALATGRSNYGPSGECIRTLKGHSDWVLALAVHKDTIISGSGRQDHQTMDPRRGMHQDPRRAFLEGKRPRRPQGYDHQRL